MMNPCQNCGKLNAASSNFCRFCGTKFGYPVPVVNNPYEFLPPPRPYAWKTDEFQTHAEPRKTEAVDRVTGNDQFKTFDNNYQKAPLAYHQPNQIGQPYRCPHCMSQFAPRLERRISSAGWITFAVLLVFFFPLFWIGLLIKEDVPVCPSCNSRVS
jgi:RNA polymerase subunit RPABC4/transcription elongation factor Spt4